MKNYSYALLISFALLLPGSASAISEPVACTMDAKMCPDGSYVGRTGPNCEFQACPGTSAVKPPYSPAMPPTYYGEEIKKGVEGEHVKDIQTILKSDPAIYSGPITGYYGTLTEAAIKKIQSKYGLPVTGVIDDATRAVLYPSHVRMEVTLLTPNGGETWKTGETQKITWRTSFAPMMNLPVEPVTNQGATVVGATMTRSAEIMPIKPTPSDFAQPFFARAMITLTRDSDPSFRRVLGTVNLYDSMKAWKIPAAIPEGKDYRISISSGHDTPCYYRKEVEAASSGRALDAMTVTPCPMSASAIAYPTYFTTDQSDGVFAIIPGMGGSDIAELKRKVADLEMLLLKVQEEVRRLREALSGME